MNSSAAAARSATTMDLATVLLVLFVSVTTVGVVLASPVVTLAGSIAIFTILALLAWVGTSRYVAKKS